MRKGKMIAQGAHASLLVSIGMEFAKSRIFIEWVGSGMAKICVSVDSEEELDSIVKQAREVGIPCALVTDAGNTEFHGVPTKTCCAVGPGVEEEVDKITGKLTLLQKGKI